MENIQVQLAAMLQQRDVSFEPISPRYFTVILIRWALALLIVLGGWSLIAYFNDMPWRVSAGIGGAYVTVAVVWLAVMKLSFKYRGIAVREYDVIFRTSFINITETLVPYNRVQHVKLTRGIWEKMLGLSALYIYTAAGGNHNLSVAGLSAEDAEKIKSYIMEKIKVSGTAEEAIPAVDMPEVINEQQDMESNRDDDRDGN